jgi:hypothetical protein
LNTGCESNYQTIFLNEAQEFDDTVINLFSGCNNYIQVPIFTNGWKRGHLTYEEFYQAPTGNPQLDDIPVQFTIYRYNMAPIKSEEYSVTFNESCSGGGVHTQYAFITSGWARLIKTETTRLVLTKQEDYEYSLTNGLLKKKTETNSDGAKRITKFKYPVDFTNTTGTGDDYAKAIHAMRTTKHMYSSVIEKEIREQPSGQSEKVVAAELVKFKQFGTSGQYYPHEIKTFSSSTAVTDFVESNIAGGVFNTDSRYQLNSTNDDYDVHGNLILSKDAMNPAIPATTVWAYNASLPVGQIRNASPSQVAVSVFDDDDASAWSSGQGVWAIENGIYKQTDGTLTTPWSSPKRIPGVSLDDVVLEADVRFDESVTPKYLGLFKYVNANDFIRFELRLLANDPDVRIFAQKAGTSTNVEVSKALTAGQWYHLRCEIQATLAKLHLDGELVADAGSCLRRSRFRHDRHRRISKQCQL